jgi:predicted Zn-dependent protease
MFYHPDLQFQFPYPERWQLINQPSAVQVVNEEENAIIVLQIDNQNNDPRSSVEEFLRQDGVNPLGTSPTSNYGLEAYEATATAQTQDGTDIQFYLYAVEYGGNIYRYVSYTLANQFERYRSQFAATANQFRPLEDDDKLDVQPVQLDVFRTDRSGRFESFLPSDLPMEITPEDVAIVNQVDLDEEIEEGTWIKIPRQ